MSKMPQVGLMNKVVVYAQPPCEKNYTENTTSIVDVPKNYSNTWSCAYSDQETDKFDMYSASNEKKKLLRDNFDCFRRTPVNLQWKNITLKSNEGKYSNDT